MSHGARGAPGLLLDVDAISLRPQIHEMADTSMYDEAATERRYRALRGLDDAALR